MIKQPDPINIKLGAELRRLRESRKLTQTKVANALKKASALHNKNTKKVQMV